VPTLPTVSAAAATPATLVAGSSRAPRTSDPIVDTTPTRPINTANTTVPDAVVGSPVVVQSSTDGTELAIASPDSASATRILQFIDHASTLGGFDMSHVPTSLFDESNTMPRPSVAAEMFALRPAVTEMRDIENPVTPMDLPEGANGARLILHHDTGNGAQIRFVDTSLAGLPELPREHTFFGVWSLQDDGSFSAADLAVRYDDLRATRLGLHENWVKLWVYEDGAWVNLLTDPTFGRDTHRNLVWASVDRPFTFFAVSTPEPTTVVGVMSALSLMLRRRRAR
jgi:hypothetical protein